MGEAVFHHRIAEPNLGIFARKEFTGGVHRRVVALDFPDATIDCDRPDVEGEIESVQ